MLMVILRHFKQPLSSPVPSIRGAVSPVVDENKRMRRGERRRYLWCCLKRAPPLTPGTAVTNHYTVEEREGAGREDPLYAQLNKPVYQNTGYMIDNTSSSAYYSDLSDRTYETVGDTWELPSYTHPTLPCRKMTNLQSDYV